jgi:hypothetical protein
MADRKAVRAKRHVRTEELATNPERRGAELRMRPRGLASLIVVAKWRVIFR